jgi:farnesyl diphosphate synthase
MLDYNIQGGKMNRGLSVIDTFQSLVNERALTPEEEEKAHVLGWCVEWLQAFFLIADDIMDQSITRRGQPCWYKVIIISLLFTIYFLFLLFLVDYLSHH